MRHYLNHLFLIRTVILMSRSVIFKFLWHLPFYSDNILIYLFRGLYGETFRQRQLLCLVDKWTKFRLGVYERWNERHSEQKQSNGRQWKENWLFTTKILANIHRDEWGVELEMNTNPSSEVNFRGDMVGRREEEETERPYRFSVVWVMLKQLGKSISRPFLRKTQTW